MKKKLMIYGSGFIDDFSNQIHQFKNNNYLALRGKKVFHNKQITR